ncbi:MAG: type IV pilus twitching motility protein PilT [Candidatus Moranbacteria bacterium]|nr:type IV pilus twitching motility protein PilT [Candidatus Moranbacteria bacterium]
MQFQNIENNQSNEAENKINSLLQFAVNQKASDLHLAVGRHPTVRIDGSLIPLEQEIVLTPEVTVSIANFLMSERNKSEFKKDGHTDFSYSLENLARFRVNVFSQKGHTGIVMRVINSEIKRLEDLGISDIVYNFANFSQGLFLVTGPVGSGKSTTLAALIDYINHNQTQNIITIEDPIEYIYTPDKSIVNQREIGQDTFTFQSALRAALREDTNVILIGEMRDLETISTAITAAETGHLIFGTLHTNDSAQTVDRIIDMFPSHQQNQVRSQLSSILLGVMSQRLIPRIDGGRVPAAEIMIKNHAIENLIREGKTYQIDTVIETGQKEGMISLDKALAELVQSGVISEEQMMIYAKNREYAQMLSKGGVQESIQIDE